MLSLHKKRARRYHGMKTDIKESLEQLKKMVERTVGREMNTPRDFDFLTICIYNLTKEHISSTTLKRLWGYQLDQQNSTPRILTLNTLSRVAGYCDWAAFQRQSVITDCESYFINNKNLFSSTLCVGEMLRLTWRPNRCVTIEYTGEEMFVVRSSENSKLDEGDIFQCPLFIYGEPLYLSHLLRKGMPISDYVCGRKDGITFDRL